MMRNEIAAYNLQCVRIRNGWSQSFVSRLTGISQRTLSRIENGSAASKSTIKKLCTLYKIDMASLYEPAVPVKPVKVNLLSDDTLYYILQRNSLLDDLQREVVLRFTTIAGRDATMDRADVEAVLEDVLSNKSSYSIQDVISACLMVNERTIQKFTNIATA